MAQHRKVDLPSPSVCRALRLAVGLSQQDVAQAVGVDRASVARWELGSREPTEPWRSTYQQVLDELRSTR